MEKLILLSSFIIILVLSVPLHELSHLFMIKILRGKRIRKMEMKWLKLDFRVYKWGFEVGVMGGGKIDGVVFPDRLEKHFRTVAFLIGLSGGLGTATVLFIIGFLLFLNPLPYILGGIWKPFLGVASLQLIYGVVEAIRLHSRVELIERQR